MHPDAEELRERPVETIMSEETATIERTVTIKEAIEQLSFQDHDVFPVVDDDNSFCGDLHQRDLLKIALDPTDLNEHELIGVMGTNIDTSFIAETVGDVMNDHDETVRPDRSVASLVRLMWNEELRAVPVVEDDGTVAGIVHEENVIAHVVDELVGDQ